MKVTPFNPSANKKFDFLLLIFLPFFAAVISLAIKANFLISTFLFFGLPSIWLSFRNRNLIKKVFLFSLILSIPFTTIIEYIAEIDGAWFIPNSVFSVWLFGVISIEAYVWGFVLVYFIIFFYEYFLDKGKNELFGWPMKLFSFILLFLLTLFFIILIENSAILHVKYAYFWIGILVLVLPAIIFLFKFPRLIFKFAKVSGFFFFVNILHEIVGLELGQWTFRGNHFIGWLVLWKHKIPLEEFIFFLVLVSFGTLTYYEFFDDDRE